MNSHLRPEGKRRNVPQPATRDDTTRVGPKGAIFFDPERKELTSGQTALAPKTDPVRPSSPIHMPSLPGQLRDLPLQNHDLLIVTQRAWHRRFGLCNTERRRSTALGTKLRSRDGCAALRTELCDCHASRALCVRSTCAGSMTTGRRSATSHSADRGHRTRLTWAQRQVLGTPPGPANGRRSDISTNGAPSRSESP